MVTRKGPVRQQWLLGCLEEGYQKFVQEPDHEGGQPLPLAQCYLPPHGPASSPLILADPALPADVSMSIHIQQEGEVVGDMEVESNQEEVMAAR